MKMHCWIIYSCIFILLIFYCVLLTILRSGLTRLKHGSSVEQPRVTVIIPAHNEEACLPRLFKRLSAQNYPKEFTEFILVDDRSTDKTFQLMQDFASSKNDVKVIQIHDLQNDLTPKKRALTQAIKIATGEIIITTDADTIPGPNWIRKIIQSYDPDIVMILGYAPYRTDGPFNTLFHRILALDYFAMGSIAAATTAIGYPSTGNGQNFSYRKSVFEEIGGFGKTGQLLSGDDDLFLHRVWKKYKNRIRFSIESGSAVYNDPPLNLRHFIRQRIRFASKHLAYPKHILLVLIMIYLLNLALLGLMVGSVFNIKILGILLIVLLVKAIFDLLFLKKAELFLEKRHLIPLYPIAVIPHIIYVVFIPPIAQMIKPKW